MAFTAAEMPDAGVRTPSGTGPIRTPEDRLHVETSGRSDRVVTGLRFGDRMPWARPKRIGT